MAIRQRWIVLYGTLTTATKNITTQVTLIRFVVGRLLGRMWGTVARVSLLGIGGAALNAGGLLMLLPVLNAITRGENSVMLLGMRVSTDGHALGALMVLALLLVVGGLSVRYRITHSALEAQRFATESAAQIGLGRLRRLEGIANLTKAVALVTGRVARACGYTMRQFSTSLADLLQLLVFVAALVWLSPLLSVALLVPAAVIGVWFSGSLRGVREAVSSKKSRKQRNLRAEVEELAALLKAPGTSDQALRETLSRLHRSGAHGQALSDSFDIRRQIRRGPIIIEALFPLALAPLALIALTTDGWQAHAGVAVVYILLLRSAIATVKSLGGQLLMLGRFHEELVCFRELHSDVMPSLFLGPEEETDDEEMLT